MQSPGGENSADRVSSSRRQAIKVMSVTVGGAVAGVGSGMLVGQIDYFQPGAWHFFTPEEARAIDAVSEQIIPADKDPGAKEAGVVRFIDRQLIGPYQRHQDTYRNGIRNLQETCRKQHGKPFEELPWDDQTKVLLSLESGRVPKELWKSASPRDFFNLVRDHTMQGFYGSPRHGGNKHYISYKMLGLEYPRVLGQNRYPGAKS